MATNGSFKVNISVVDNASKALAGINKQLAAARAPGERLQKQLGKFAELTGLSKLQTSLGKTVQQIKSLAEPLAAITSLATVAGMERLITSWGDWGKAIQTNARLLGTTTSNLAALQGASRLAGGIGDEGAQMLQNFQDMQRKIALHDPSTVNQQRLFQRMNINPMAGAEQNIERVLDYIQSIKGNPALQRAIMGEFGIPSSMINVSGKRYRAQQQDAAGLLHATDANARAAADFANAETRVQLALQGVTNQIAGSLGPVLTPMLNQFANWLAHSKAISTEMQALPGQVKQLGDWLKGLDWQGMLTGAEGFAKTVNSIAQALGGWKDVLLAILGIKFASWAAGIVGPLATATGALTRFVTSRGAASLLGTAATTAAEGATAAGGLAALPLAAAGVAAGVAGNATAGFIAGQRGTGSWVDTHLLTHGTTVTNAQTRANQAIAMRYLTSQGMSAQTAAAYVGNFTQESGLNPGAVNGTHVGLAQWSTDRQAAIAAHFHKSVSQMNLGEQLAALTWEQSAQGPYARVGARVAGSKNLQQASSVVDQQFEAPGDYEVEDPRRYSYATNVLQNYQAASAGSLSAAKPTQISTPVAAPAADQGGDHNLHISLGNFPAGSTAMVTGGGGGLNIPSPTFSPVFVGG